jgi:NAD-dependent dihydropyrimidine dehydrogenase PreA subunit
MKEDKAEIDPETCTECETCVAECPVEAIKVK